MHGGARTLTHTHTPSLVPSLASQTHFRKRGKVLVNSIYKPCHGALYCASQSRCSILSHDALHHCFSSNSSLENSERDPKHLSRYYRNCKNTSRIVFRERAYRATGNSRVHYLKSSYIIQLIAFRWDKACMRSSPDPSLSCGSRSGLRDYLVPSPLLERDLGTRLTPTFTDTSGP